MCYEKRRKEETKIAGTDLLRELDKRSNLLGFRERPEKKKARWKMKELECRVCGSRLIDGITGAPYKVQCRACGNVFYRDDEIDHPNHYTEGKYEVIDIIRRTLTAEEYVGYLKGNIIKYSCRAGLKGDRQKDVAKRDKYMDFLNHYRGVYRVSE